MNIKIKNIQLVHIGMHMKNIQMKIFIIFYMIVWF